MHKWAAVLILLFSLVHLVMTFVLFPDAVTRILSAGPFGGNKWAFDDPEALAAFWFAAFTWPGLALGASLLASYRKNGFIAGAKHIGLVLAGSVVLCGVLLPLSGLWLFLIPALMLILGTRSEKGDPKAADQSSR